MQDKNALKAPAKFCETMSPGEGGTLIPGTTGSSHLAHIGAGGFHRHDPQEGPSTPAFLCGAVVAGLGEQVTALDGACAASTSHTR